MPPILPKDLLGAASRRDSDKAQARRDCLLFAAAGALPTLGCRDYQLNCSLRFMSGWPPMLEVRWSALILANVFGLRKSTVVVGLLQA